MGPADIASLFFEDEEPSPAKAAALADALRGQQSMGMLGLLSGDKVLGGVGQHLLQGAGRQQGMLAELGQHRQQGMLRRSLEAQKQAAEAARAELERRQKLEDTSAGNSEWDRRNAVTSVQQEKRAHIMAGRADQAARATAERGTVIPGLEKEPGAQPTLQDATKVKASLESARKIKEITGALRQLHQAHGTELTGEHATRMKQLQTALKIEGKNIAELGALSGPDEALMDSLIGVDLTSVGANLKSLVGVDNTAKALEGVEAWANGALGSVKKTYGYRDAPGAAKDAPPQTGGLSAEKAARLAELRRKRDARAGK